MEKLEFKKIIKSKSFWGHIFRFFSTVVVGLGIVIGYADTYFGDVIDNRIDFKHIEDEKNHRPLDELLSEAMDIPIQVVPYEIALKFQMLDSLLKDIEEFSKTLLPYIEKEMFLIRPRLEIDPDTGEEIWWGRDGRPYRVGRYEKDIGYIWYHGDWKQIFR